ncbi:G-type lectin S-receptor-like serine/threonine-protein kinase At4g27290 isoform X1 [Tasmannia lanceolata]|uniref:G-type lectin S-receptor-like serine/threonine-protein kinase At4g27290 isoform X1 n=2 Tax=Tasmannia lanceolata TaxID=3420 RepID=UPI0040649E2B
MAFELRYPYGLLISIFLLQICSAVDTITPTQSIKDGETLVSEGEKFALGFFSPGNSRNRYVGIWYNKLPGQTVVWVANRETPLTDSSGVLTIAGDGNLVILDGSLKSPWSTNISILASNTNAMLLGSGNLILCRDNCDNHTTTLWESFNYPAHVLLPGMKHGFNRKTGHNWSLTSWRSQNDPGNGEFSNRLDPEGWPEFYLWKGPDRIWRNGIWNSQRLVHPMPDRNVEINFNFSYISNEDEVYVTSNAKKDSLITMMDLDYSGIFQRLIWNEESHRWVQFWSALQDQCDNYAVCGPYGICSVTRTPVCECLQGFEPKSPQNWLMRDGSDGCERRMSLDCRNGSDGFLRLEHVKSPDTRKARLDASLSSNQCENECLNNCSCTAYASADANGWGNGCVIWYGDLIDIKFFDDGGDVIYVRLAVSELDTRKSKSSLGRKRMLVIAIVIISLVVLLLLSCGCWRWRMRRKMRVLLYLGLMVKESSRENLSRTFEPKGGMNGMEFPLFDLGTVVAATENFSDSKKLGEGGFGPVYKGKLFSGQEIAVKRLSRNSGQGTEEFRNEVMLISKLQHRNLVKILGYCIQGEEKMLIYEYMPNNSLDSYIFDQSRRALLAWSKRFDIIVAIARGVLYLHEDSRLRIIHRDLKASNVLLDNEMNPKISDFGLARIFGGNQTQANTRRVVGTYGYMSPEYAMNGLFSVKSDVFSFGVILLEIISGKKNSCYVDDPSITLIGHVWELWKEDRALELLDPSIMVNTCAENEVLRCIHVGLLCVQESPSDRPTMSAVVFMLGNETTMNQPKKPAFSFQDDFKDRNRPTGGTGLCSINEMSITELESR